MSIDIDTSGLEEFAEQIAKLADKDAFMEACVKEQMARLLDKLKHTTPSMSGDLRKGWSTDSVVRKVGSTYIIEFSNDKEYASYVEEGHNVHLKNGDKRWVPGAFMLKITERQLRSSTADNLEKKLKEWIEEVLS